MEKKPPKKKIILYYNKVGVLCICMDIDYDALMVWWARGAMKHETNDRVSIMNFTYCRCR